MPSFPEPRYVKTNGLRMAIHEKGTGIPVVMCHGFPELAYSWRHQTDTLAQAGFHAIAPDMRGYGNTGGPKGREAVAQYDMEHLTADLAGLLDALGYEKAIFCGHDWGGFVVWQMPLLYPERVAGVIGVNTPFIPRGAVEPITAMRAAMGEDMYIVYFQKFGEAEALFGADVDRSVRYWFRKLPITLAEYDQLPPENKTLALAKGFREPEKEWMGEPLLSSEEHAFYVKAFTKTGYEGGINWYRNFTRNWEKSAGLEEKIDVPCLMISAANDIVLRPEMTEGMENICADLEKHIIPDCGHWTQAEKPAELSALMVNWLTKRFG